MGSEPPIAAIEDTESQRGAGREGCELTALWGMSSASSSSGSSCRSFAPRQGEPDLARALVDGDADTTRCVDLREPFSDNATHCGVQRSAHLGAILTAAGGRSQTPCQP